MIPTQRAPEVRLDLLTAGPALEPQSAPGRVRGRAVLAVLLAAAGATGAGWGLQQPDQRQAPVLVSVQKAVTEQPGQHSWGTLGADLPGTSCGALVDWDVLSASRSGVERTLPCADGSEVRASITVDDDLRQLRISLEAPAAALTSAPPHARP